MSDFQLPSMSALIADVIRRLNRAGGLYQESTMAHHLLLASMLVTAGARMTYRVDHDYLHLPFAGLSARVSTCSRARHSAITSSLQETPVRRRSNEADLVAFANTVVVFRQRYRLTAASSHARALIALDTPSETPREAILATVTVAERAKRSTRSALLCRTSVCAT